MSKKNYFEPEMEEILLNVNAPLLAGSLDEDGGEAANFPGGTTPYIDPNED